MTDPGGLADDSWPLLDDPAALLPCGADVDQLLEQAADGQAAQLTEHQQDCPHCQAALQELSRAWEPVRRTADTPVPFPAEVRSAVAGEVRKLTADVRYAVDLADGGAIQIPAGVVGKVACEAARKVPGVRVVFGRSAPAEVAGLGETAPPRHHHPRAAVIDLAVVAEYGQELDALARDVQQRVAAELRERVGLRDVLVNVIVDDIVS